jgi:hypothetical protein
MIPSAETEEPVEVDQRGLIDKVSLYPSYGIGHTKDSRFLLDIRRNMLVSTTSGLEAAYTTET